MRMPRNKMNIAIVDCVFISTFFMKERWVNITSETFHGIA
jgi:hypothetical protein